MDKDKMKKLIIKIEKDRLKRVIEAVKDFPEVIVKAKAVSEKGYGGRPARVLYSGKWYPVANCGVHGLPSTTTAARIIRTIMFNTGSYDSLYKNSQTKEGYHTKFNPNKGVFGGKKIVLEWVHIDNIIPRKEVI